MKPYDGCIPADCSDPHHNWIHQRHDGNVLGPALPEPAHEAGNMPCYSDRIWKLGSLMPRTPLAEIPTYNGQKYLNIRISVVCLQMIFQVL